MVFGDDSPPNFSLNQAKAPQTFGGAIIFWWQFCWVDVLPTKNPRCLRDEFHVQNKRLGSDVPSLTLDSSQVDLNLWLRWLTNSLIVYILEDSRWPDFRPRLGRGFASHYAMRGQVCFQTPEITALWPRGDLCLPLYVRRASPNRCVAVAACMHCLCQTFLQAVELRRDPRCGSLLAASIMMLLGPMHGKRTNFWCITTRIIQKLPWLAPQKNQAATKQKDGTEKGQTKLPRSPGPSLQGTASYPSVRVHRIFSPRHPGRNHPSDF